MKTEYCAFHGDEQYKVDLNEMAKQHRLADQYLQGTYGKGIGKAFKGCSVACTVKDVNKLRRKRIPLDSHSKLANELGVPKFICGLQDSIFEGLPIPLNQEWTERLLTAIPAGKDLSLVLPRFLLRLLDSLPDTDRKDVVDSINGVREVLTNWAKKGEPDLKAARAAEAAARAARAGAAEAGAGAWAAARAARAARAAEAGAWAWTARAAWAAVEAGASWEQMANFLIEEIENG